MTKHCQKIETVTRPLVFLVLLGILSASLEGCAADGNTRPVSPISPSLSRRGERLVSDTLFFGLSTARGPVSEADWNNFLRDIITPRFPDGLTYWPASGQWRGSDNQIVREPSMVLQIIHPDSPQADLAILEIILRYEQQHEQDSVLRVRDVVEVWR